MSVTDVLYLRWQHWAYDYTRKRSMADMISNTTHAWDYNGDPPL